MNNPLINYVIDSIILRNEAIILLVKHFYAARE